MSFKKAAGKVSEIKDCLEAGLHALGSNSSKVKPANTRKVNGSINLDGCVQSIYPDDSRWDYIVGYKNEAVFIEIHPAATGNVREMINKLNWLKKWLKKKAPEINEIKTKDKPFRWVTTKKVAILKGSRQAIILAKSGLTFPQKITELI